MFKNRRQKYSLIAATSAASYMTYHDYMAPSFDDNLNLVFPKYRSNTKNVQDRTVKIQSANQL